MGNSLDAAIQKLEIHPDKLMDARQLEFPDNSFYLVVLDPPHLINCGKRLTWEGVTGCWRKSGMQA